LGEVGTRGTRKGPAPAGALQRGYGSDGYGGEEYDEPGAGSSYAQEEAEYAPRRGQLRLRFRGLRRSVGGRIVFGVLVFGVLAAVAVAAAGARYYLMHDARFVLTTTDDIQITGAEHLTRDQVLSVFGADLERNIFRVSLAERQADLERLPWVAHATVMRLLPNVLRVEITERMPVAFVRQGTQIGLVDASGVLLDMPPDAAGDPHYSFPVLTGLSSQQTLAARAARMQIYQQFMHDLDSTGQHLTDSVSEVDVSDPEDVKALITSGSSDILVHFGEEQFLKRYKEFEEHLPEWRQAYPKLASADMRYEGQIVLEMQGDGDAATGDGATTDASSGVAGGVAAAAAPVVAAKQVVAKGSRPAAKKVVERRPRRLRAGSGMDAANQRVFARLAAQHRAALAREHRAKP
jgi:cell division protein FtsQ